MFRCHLTCLITSASGFVMRNGVYFEKQDHLGKLCKCIRNLSTEKKYQLQTTGSCDACWTSLGFSYVFLKLHNIQSEDTKRVIAGRYIIYHNILKRVRVSSKWAMATRSWNNDFQLKIARVHQRKYLCKAEKCPSSSTPLAFSLDFVPLSLGVYPNRVTAMTIHDSKGV